MPNAEHLNAVSMVDLAMQKIKDEFIKADQAVIDVKKRNEELAEEVMTLKQDKRELEHQLVECVTLGRRAQSELKMAKEKIEEYEKLLHKT